MRVFHSIWLLFSTVSALCALIVAFYLFKIRRENNGNAVYARYMAFAFLGVGLEALLARLPLNQACRFTGRTVEMLTLGALALYFIGLLPLRRKKKL